MGRKILAVIVAWIVAAAIMLIGQMGMAAIWAAPSPTIREDPAAMRAYIEGLPTQAFVVLTLVYVIASFAAGFIVTKMARRVSPGTTLPLIIGVLLFIGGILNFFVTVPYHPTWFAALNLILFIPVTLLGHRVARG